MNKIRVLQGIAGGVGLVVVLGGLFWGIPAAIDANRPAAVTPAAEPAPVYLISDYRHPTPTPEPVVAPPPPPPAEVYEEPVYVPGQPGDAVPFIPSSDPNNANGGDYIDPGMYSLSGSASGFPPTCD